MHSSWLSILLQGVQMFVNVVCYKQQTTINVHQNKNKTQFLLYVFNNVNTNMVNNKNAIYPNIDEDKDLPIFNFDVIGLDDNYRNGLVQYSELML